MGNGERLLLQTGGHQTGRILSVNGIAVGGVDIIQEVVAIVLGGGTLPGKQIGGGTVVYGETGSWSRCRCSDPVHRWDEGWIRVKVLREGIYVFHIVCEELRAEESDTKTLLAQHVHLATDDIEVPVLFSRMKHIDGQSRSHLTSITVLLPIDDEGIEVIALEVHHGEEGIHQTIAQPTLCVLTDGGVGIPAETLVTAQVVVLADR